MTSLSIHTCQQSRDLDRYVIEEVGICGFELMSRAGRGAFDILLKHWPHCNSIAVICGRGNNGGDGYILATAAIQAEMNICVFGMGEPLSPDAKKSYDEYSSLGGTIKSIDETIPFDDYDIVVDALFGSGLKRDIEGRLRQLVQTINACGQPVFALDIPSGLDGDSGQVRGEALHADVTAAFISTKLGLVTGVGKDYRGVLELNTLGVPSEAYTAVEKIATLIDNETLAAWKLKRKSTAHKGSAGRVLIVGGNSTMQGAAIMAGQAACRAGAGLVSIATASVCAQSIAAGAPEIRSFPIESAATLMPLLKGCDIVGIGPGLGQDAWASRMWRAALREPLRMVVDADALNLLAKQPQRSSEWILTPHPGEAGRLLACSTQEIQLNRIGAAQAIVERYGGICVLKGSGTIVADDQNIWICDRGNPGMAAGGMGDVLTGVICALWAQGLTAQEAACLGVWLHACAGDDSARQAGEIGMMATDLLPGIRTNLARAIENVPRTVGH